MKTADRLRVLITGGAGFIGRHLSKALLAHGHHVRVLDTLSTQVHGPAPRVPPELANAEFVQGDVRDAAALSPTLHGIDAVVHLAAETGVGQSMYEVTRYVDVNDRGTASLLEALVRRQQPVRLVLASSRAIYGEGLYRCSRCGDVSPAPRDVAALDRAQWDPRCPQCGGSIVAMATHEDVPPHPTSVYAATKLAQERLCQIIAEAYGFPLTILRYFNVYGPGQSLSNPYTGMLSAFYVRASGGKTIEIFEDGLESRDFIFIDDVVEATRRALLLPDQPRAAQIVNVGSGAAVSVADLARTMRRIGGWDVPIEVTGAYRVGDVRHAYADTRRCARVLGITSVTPLDEGLRRWLRWAEGSAFHDATDLATAQLTASGLYRRGGGA